VDYRLVRSVDRIDDLSNPYSKGDYWLGAQYLIPYAAGVALS
jgi:hypothetical protein